MEPDNHLFAAWLSGRTVRKHTMHVHRRENIAEHTWGMLLLLIKYMPGAGVGLMRYLVLHDAGEAGACDVPANVCAEMPQLKAEVRKREDAHVLAVMTGPNTFAPSYLSDEDKAVAETLDRAEFLLSCYYEYMLGNRMLTQTLRNGIDYMQAAVEKIPPGNTAEAMQALSKDVMRLLANVEKQK